MLQKTASTACTIPFSALLSASMMEETAMGLLTVTWILKDDGVMILGKVVG